MITVIADDTVATTSVDVVIDLNDLNDAPTLDRDCRSCGDSRGRGRLRSSTSPVSALAPGETQNILSVTASSSNTAVMPDPTETYTPNDATGSLNYTPVPGASGTAVITVTVQDDGGVVGGGVDTVVETFTVTVTSVNDAPTIDAIADPAAVLEDALQQAVALDRNLNRRRNADAHGDRRPLRTRRWFRTRRSRTPPPRPRAPSTGLL